MEKKDYLKERVEDQINWYSQKSSKNKYCYYTINHFRIISIYNQFIFRGKYLKNYSYYFIIINYNIKWATFLFKLSGKLDGIQKNIRNFKT